MFNDPGDNIGPKSCDLWKPVIAAVNGMACGGAFYMLGEVEFIIAAEHATFFDPHVTYGMTAAFEPIHMAGHHAVRRDHAPVAARQLRAHVGAARASRSAWCPRSCPATQLRDAARVGRARSSRRSRSSRSGHRARDLGDARDAAARRPSRLGYAYVAMGTNQDSIAEGQKLFASGKRVEWRLR